MSRRNSGAAENAALQASEAARVLQQRSQEARVEKTEPEPAPEKVSRNEDAPGLDSEKIEKLRKNSPRVAAMEEIARKRDPQPEPEPETAPAKAEEKPKDDPKPAAEAPAPEAAPAAPEAPKTVRVKVDGEEFDAPADEVEAAGGVKSYQIHKAAENRLKKAQEVLAEAQKSRVDIGQLVQAIRQPQPEKPKESDEQFIASKMDVIRFGSPEEAAKAQVEIIQRLSKPVDQNAIVAQATNQWKHDQAVAAFDREFQDISTNPIRLKAAVALREERLQRHKIENPNQTIDWDRFYRTIGNEVRSAFGGQSQAASAPAATTGTPSQPSEKEARKASIVNLPAAAARAELPAEEKALSPEEERRQAIAEMKKRRGQAG